MGVKQIFGVRMWQTNNNTFLAFSSPTPVEQETALQYMKPTKGRNRH